MTGNVAPGFESVQAVLVESAAEFGIDLGRRCVGSQDAVDLTLLVNSLTCVVDCGEPGGNPGWPAGHIHAGEPQHQNRALLAAR